MSSYTVLAEGTEVVAQLERKKSRFLTVLRRAGSTEEAQDLLEGLRKEHHGARHHCSAWVIGHDRRVQRAQDDGEPSGTAGAPMLEALTRVDMPSAQADLSDVAVVVVRWFGGTLLGAGGLVSAYSDSVLAALEQARAQGLLLTRRRMRQFSLNAPIAEAGRWENELRSEGILVAGADYTAQPGSAVLELAVGDTPDLVEGLHTRVASLSSGTAGLTEAGIDWADL